MPDTWSAIALLPENGLDRSLHAPVFIGLLLMSGFREALGWTFAGLVVPGYLATVLLAAPVTGLLVVCESILTYLLALLLGRALPRTGAWFTFFGRERFLLLIAAASLVRLAVEAGLLPALVARWDLTHSRELYSLGLVLVPLLANSFWNAGFVRAFPRIALVTMITYWIVAEILLPHTNFTLSRFQVANESVSLAFLESPHAHVILLIGAILAARYNVRYGWDYNGILVPALLAVAWYQPTKVATTLMEALVVYYLSLGLVRLSPFSRMMIVGSRRVVLTFSIGFVVKYVAGMLLMTWWPQVQMIDFFGFGYLLPSLLANKMWDRGSVANVLMPTLHVSVLAFPLGTLVGFALRAIDAEAATAERAVPVEVVPSPALALMRGDTAPSPHHSGTSWKLVDAYGVGLELARRGLGREVDARVTQLARRGLLHLEQSPARDWTVVTPSAGDPNADATGPRFALRTTRRYGDRWLVIVRSPEVASPAHPIAFALAQRVGARAVVVTSRLPVVAGRDRAFASELMQVLDLDDVLSVSLSDDDRRVAVSATGRLPPGLTTGLLEETFGSAPDLSWRGSGADGGARDREVRLSIPRSLARAVAARELGAAPLVEWTVETHERLQRRLAALSISTPQSFRVPDVPALRLYGDLLTRRFLAPGPPDDWQRALARALGLEFARVRGAVDAWALYEGEGPDRRGSPTLLQRLRSESSPPGLMLTLAAPRWQRGGTAAAARLHDAFDADTLLVHGALVSSASDGSADPRRPQGRQSFFQRALETWLNVGGHAIVLRGMTPERFTTADAVVAYDAEVTGVRDGPAWALPLISGLQVAGVRLAAVDGTAERAGLEASRDPGVSYARRFAAGRSLVLWMSARLRQRWRLAPTRSSTSKRLERLGLPWHSGAVAALAAARTPCGSSTSSAGCRTASPADCTSRDALGSLGKYQRTQNPFFLEAALEHGIPCGWVGLVAAHTETTWLALPGHSPAAGDSAARLDGPNADGSRVLLVPLSGSDPDFDLAGGGWPLVSSAGFERLRSIALQPLELSLP